VEAARFIAKGEGCLDYVVLELRYLSSVTPLMANGAVDEQRDSGDRFITAYKLNVKAPYQMLQGGF
jgi:hypothetical protein